MRAINVIKTGQIIGIIALLSLSAVFWLWFFSPESETELIALTGGLVSIILTLIAAIAYLSGKNKNSVPKKKKRNLLIITFSNILAVVLYLYMGSLTMNTDRILFINNTESDMVNIKFEGAGSKSVRAIKAGGKKCIWIKLESEGELIMNYKQNDKEHERIVNDYTGPLQGSKYIIRTDTTKQ